MEGGDELVVPYTNLEQNTIGAKKEDDKTTGTGSDSTPAADTDKNNE
jgi:hypothetical protein